MRTSTSDAPPADSSTPSCAEPAEGIALTVSTAINTAAAGRTNR